MRIYDATLEQFAAWLQEEERSPATAEKYRREAGVAEGKVFPHNLRHLFARTYCGLEKDIVRLADILGHSSINTTRIYTMESGRTHRMVSTSEKAFQDGVELDTALILSDSCDSSVSMKDVRPGSTIDVQCAFVLSSQTSNVEFELSALFSFSKSAPKVVKNFTFE